MAAAMARDDEFHELAVRFPEAVLALLGRRPRGPYRATSVELKRTSRRIDILLEPERDDEPLWIVEMQRRTDRLAEQTLLRKAVELADRRPDARERIEAVIVYPRAQTAAASRSAAIGRGGRLVRFAPRRVVLSGVGPGAILRRGGVALAALPLVGSRQDVLDDAPRWAERIRREPGLPPARRRSALEVFERLLADRLDMMDVTQLLGGTVAFRDTATGKAMMREAAREAAREATKRTARKARSELLSAQLTAILGPLEPEVAARLVRADVATLDRIGLLVARRRSKPALEKALAAELGLG